METFPECLKFENYYFRGNGEFSQQTQQMWAIFIYYCFQMGTISSVFEDDTHVNLRYLFFFLALFCILEVPHILILAILFLDLKMEAQWIC